MVLIGFGSETADLFWRYIRRPRIATVEGGTVLLEQALMAGSFGINTSRWLRPETIEDIVLVPDLYLTTTKREVKRVLLEVARAGVMTNAKIAMPPVDIPGPVAGETRRVLHEVGYHRWATDFRNYRVALNRTVDGRSLLGHHTERLLFLHANGYFDGDQLVDAVRTLGRIDCAGSRVKGLAWDIERFNVLSTLEDFHLRGIEEHLAVSRLRDSVQLMSGLWGSSTTDTLEEAAWMLRWSGYERFTSHVSSQPVVKEFVEAVKDFRVGRGLVAGLSVVTLAFGAWQLFGGEAAHSRLSKAASLGLNAVGMLGCTLASPLAIAGTIVSAGFLASEAHEFFKNENQDSQNFNFV